MNEFADSCDGLTVDDLRAGGGLKWTAYPNTIGAWVAELDFGVASEVSDAVQSMLSRKQLGYAPMELRSELKSATAEFVSSQYDWTIDPEQVQWLPDVLTGLAVVMTHWIPRGSKVAVLTPCYFPFVDMPGTFGDQRIDVPMVSGDDEWVLDLDALEQAFADGAKLLILANPHNPLGKVYTRAELEAICEIVDRHHGMVFSDEIHAPLILSGSPAHVPYASINETAAGHTVTGMSASKSFNVAGLKCAQMVVTNPDQLHFLATQGHGLPYEASPLGMAANIAAYRHGGPWLDQVRSYLDQSRTLVTTMLGQLMPKVGYIEPQASFLAWLDCRELGLENPYQSFFDAGVSLTDGAECGEAGINHVRLNFGMPHPILIEALEKMASVQ